MRGTRIASAIRCRHLVQRGVAHVELAFMLLVVAVLAAVTVPSFANLLVSQRLRAAGAELVSSLEIARSEAIRRNGTVTVRPAADNWSGGWVVATALGDSLASTSARDARVIVASAPVAVVYGPDGRLLVPDGTRFQFSDAQNAAGVMPRCVIVDTSGPPRIEARPCD